MAINSTLKIFILDERKITQPCLAAPSLKEQNAWNLLHLFDPQQKVKLKWE